MNRLHPLMISVGLSIFLCGTGSSIQAQNTGATTSAVAEVYADPSLPGRPTLKSRQTDSAKTDTSESKNTEPFKQPSRSSSSEVENSLAIRFEGLNAVSKSDVLWHFRRKGMALVDRLVGPEVSDKAAAHIKELLEAKGYLNASVQVMSDEALKAITFQVNEGARLPLAAIRFEGLRLFSSSELEAEANECLSRLSSSQNSYDQDRLEYCLRRVSDFVRSKGYLQAKFAEPKRECAGNGVVVNVDVKEGPQFRLGEIKIQGSDRFSVDQLRRMFLLQRGEIVNALSISKWLFEDVRELYGDLGYMEFTVEINPKFKTVAGNDGEGIVDFEVTIEEGKQFKVASINLKGVDLPADLVEYSSLRPGDIYRPKAFQEFVDRLKATGLFEPIDKDKDSDFITNDQEALVSITLKLLRRSE